MRITDDHRRTLCEMIHFAFEEIRLLASTGNGEQAAGLADAFLVDYQEKYPDERIKNYIAVVNRMLADGEDHRSN
jgi:hypothetical protein